MTLLISDVPGDDPADIASGPTVADATTCADALAIARRYGIDAAARRYARSSKAAPARSVKPGDPRLAALRDAAGRDAADGAGSGGRGRPRRPGSRRTSSATPSKARRATSAR